MPALEKDIRTLIARVYSEFLNWLAPEVVGRMGDDVLVSYAIKSYCTRYEIDNIEYVEMQLTTGAEVDEPYQEGKMQVLVVGKSSSGEGEVFSTDFLGLGRMPVADPVSWKVRIYVDDSIRRKSEKTG